MNFKIIIHALILIFILHIIIINLDYEINIGKKIENFNNSDKNTDKNSDSKSLDFLLENKEKDNEFIKKMNELSNLVENPKKVPEFEKKNQSEVLPSNNYINNENLPNFESDVLDTSKLYKIQNNYDNLEEKQLKTTSIEDLNKKNNNIITEINKVDTQVRQSEEKPNVWEYNNEFAMNGGTMNGIVGFDSLESQYSSFGSILDMKKDTKNNFNEIPEDDLRKPVVVN